jgi:hypothetical protein
VDRSASFRGTICASQTQRTASEAWDYMRNGGNLRGLYVSGWWLLYEKPEYHDFGKASPLSTDIEAMKPIVDPTTVVNISPETQSHFPMPDKVVITYISIDKT